MKIKASKKLAFTFYITVFLVFIIRYMAFDFTLGYGLGDLIYLVGYTLWAVLTTIFYFANRDNNKITLVINIINIVVAIHLILMMFFMRGPE